MRFGYRVFWHSDLNSWEVCFYSTEHVPRGQRWKRSFWFSDISKPIAFDHDLMRTAVRMLSTAYAYEMAHAYAYHQKRGQIVSEYTTSFSSAAEGKT